MATLTIQPVLLPYPARFPFTEHLLGRALVGQEVHDQVALAIGGQLPQPSRTRGLCSHFGARERVQGIGLAHRELAVGQQSVAVAKRRDMECERLGLDPPEAARSGPE